MKVGVILKIIILKAIRLAKHFYNFDLRRFVFLKGDYRMVFKAVCFIDKYVLFLRDLYVSLVNEICSRHDIAEILLKLSLNTNQSINQSSYQDGQNELLPLFFSSQSLIPMFYSREW
jgi:hypothetical protein